MTSEHIIVRYVEAQSKREKVLLACNVANMIFVNPVLTSFLGVTFVYSVSRKQVMTVTYVANMQLGNAEVALNW
jgi:hypothetical protein